MNRFNDFTDEERKTMLKAFNQLITYKYNETARRLKNELEEL